MNAPASRTFEHCREWVKAGHDVTVLTCAPNFPGGRIFQGYRNRLWQREEMEGIEVVRVWSYVAANEGFLRRTLDYLSFMLAACVAAPFTRRPDVVVATSPQFFTACAGYFVGRMRRAPFVFELRDLWPESIRAVGALRQSSLLDLLERIELFLYRRAALIVSVTHSSRDDLARRGIDPGKVAVVTNGVDASRFSPRPRDAALVADLGLGGCFVAGYIGTHGLAHDLHTLLEAAERLQNAPGTGNVRILLLGDGAMKASLVDAARARGLRNVLFLDSVKKDEVPRYWSLLDVSIIHLRKTPLFKTVIPSKLFECMGMGIPVLHGVEGESAGIVEAQAVGLPFEPGNASALCEALLTLRDHPDRLLRMSKRGPDGARRYDRTVLARDMLVHLERVAAEWKGSATD